MPKIVCPQCGKSNPPANKFCGECGAPLAARATTPHRGGAEAFADPPPPPEGERKQVTVLITDIKGSLEMLADRDPEDANRLLDAVLHLMMDAVHQHGGTVSQTRGDGMLAIFGAPLALEDHAVRGCLAALGIQRAVETLSERTMREEGFGVQVRVGLHSGEVVVRPMRNDLYMEYTAVGQTVHLAGRMEQLALPGKILATAQTVRLAEHHVDARALGPVEVRGLGTPVEIYEITGTGHAGMHSRFANGRPLTPFVGRIAEIEVLRAALLDAESGLGQAVTIIGDAGVGKSRLIHEFLQLPENAEWRVIESHASGHGRGRSYAPFIELLHANFRVDTPDTVARMGDMLERLQQPARGVPEEDVPALLGLLDALPSDHRHLQLPPQEQRLAIFRAVTGLLRAESRLQPLVIVLEHLDQNDSLSMQLLAEVVSQIQDDRVLLLCTQRPRPGDTDAPPPPGRQLRLQPLEPAEFNEFMDGLLGDDPSLRPIKPFLREHALGNPFYSEEIVHALADAGVLAGTHGRRRLSGTLPQFQLPGTLQALLAARIDRVQADDKRILQSAAVVGPQVPLWLLGSITGLSRDALRGALQRLEQAGLLMPARLFPEAECSFANRLTHEVAYAELLRSQRSSIHAQIVEAIEHRHADQLADWTEPLANHAFLGQAWNKAQRYLREAARRAQERQAYAEASQLCARALQAVEQLPEGIETTRLAIDLRFEICGMLEPMGEHARMVQVLQESGAMAQSIGDTLRMARHGSLQASHCWLQGQYEAGQRAGLAALAIAEAQDALPLLVATHTALGLLDHAQGQFRSAAAHLEWNTARLQGEHLVQRAGTTFLPSVHSRAFLAWCQAEMGDFRQALATSLTAERLAVELNHPSSLAYALLAQGVTQLRQGEVVRAMLALQRAMGLPGIADSPIGRAWVACHLGFAMTLADRMEDGLELLERSVAAAQSHGFLAHQGIRLAYLAEAQLRAGHEAQATAVAERSLHLARAHGEQAGEAYARRVLAECALRRGYATEAGERYRDCLQQAEQLRMLPLQAYCHDGLARVADAGSDFSAGRTHRLKADTLAATMDMQFWAPPSPGAAMPTWEPPRYMRH